MLRKIDLETIPEKLKSLLRKNTVQVPIGDSIYEMSQMGYKDLKIFEQIGDNVKQFFADKESFDVGNMPAALVNSGIFEYVLERSMNLSKEDISNITLPQMLYIAERWLYLNFFSLPEDSQEQLLWTVNYLLSMLSVPTMSSEEETLLEETPPELEKPQE